MTLTRRDLLKQLGICTAGLAMLSTAGAAPAPNASSHLACLPTGFPALDEMLGGGLLRGGLTVLGARPSMGKTSLATAITLGVARRPVPGSVAYFSFDESREEMLQRAVYTTAAVSRNDLRRGRLGQDDWARLTEAMNSLATTSLYIDYSAGRTVAEVRNEACRLRQSGDLDLVVLDFLQLIPGQNSRRGHAPPAEYWEVNEEDRFEEVFEIGRQLQGLARELEVPVLLLSHVKREVEERKDKRPHLEDLRNAAALEPHVDACLTLFRSEYYRPEVDPGRAEVIVRKYPTERLGTARVGFEMRCQRFYTLPAEACASAGDTAQRCQPSG